MRASPLVMLLVACRANPEAGKPGDSGGSDPGGGPEDSAPLVDRDQDGWTEAEGDCDDDDPGVHPEATETWYDGVYQNCDGNDRDQDGDGYAALDAGGDDCLDTDPSVHPGATEAGDGVDDDCDGRIDEGTERFDDDGDGFAESEGDCDDADARLSPGATEACDGLLDGDCDGAVDEAEDVLGSAEACPAASFLDLLGERPGLPDGVYWIEVDGHAFEVNCDMTRDTGGWTLVANFVWPGHTGGVAGWTSGGPVGTTTTDRTQSFKLDDSEINALVTVRYRARGIATWCTLEDRSTGTCAVDTTLYWSASCVYDSGSPSTGDCTAAYQTYDLQGWTTLSNPCPWHYGLTSADCGVTSEFGTSHEGDHVFAGLVGTYVHAYDGRADEDPSIELWVR